MLVQNFHGFFMHTANLRLVIGTIALLYLFIVIRQSDVSREDVLAAGYRPAVEVLDGLDTSDFNDVLANMINANVSRCALHEDCVALKEHAVRREHDNDGEQVRADWVNNLPLGPNLNNYGCYEDADRLQQVSDQMHNCSFQIQVVIYLALRAVVADGSLLIDTVRIITMVMCMVAVGFMTKAVIMFFTMVMSMTMPMAMSMAVR